jgi:hypothetical protein
LLAAQKHMRSWTPPRKIDKFWVAYYIATLAASRLEERWDKLLHVDCMITGFLLQTSTGRIRKHVQQALDAYTTTQYSFYQLVRDLVVLEKTKCMLAHNSLFFNALAGRRELSSIARTERSQNWVRMKVRRMQEKSKAQRSVSHLTALSFNQGSTVYEVDTLFSNFPEAFVVEEFYGHMLTALSRAKARLHDFSIFSIFSIFQFALGTHHEVRMFHLKWRIAFRIATEHLIQTTEELYQMKFDLAALRYFRLSNSASQVSGLQIARGRRLIEILDSPSLDAPAARRSYVAAGLNYPGSTQDGIVVDSHQERSDAEPSMNHDATEMQPSQSNMARYTRAILLRG